MCNRKNDNTCCCDSCIAEILQVICVLQANACPTACLNSCDRPVLGGGSNCVVYNTRPIMLYTCCGNGEPWRMPVSRTNSSCEGNQESSCVFRVEKVDGCCVTFRVLAPAIETNCIYPYVATDSIFTMDLNCCCCVRCLNDTFVDCL